MTVYATDNFDSDTVGSIAPGWINKVGTWQVGTVNPISGANTFRSTTNGDGDVALYTGGTATADMQVDTSQILVAAGGKLPMIGHVLRSDSANANNYTILTSAVTTAGYSIIVFKKVGSTFTALNTDTGTAFVQTLAAGDVVRLRTKIVGSTITVYFGRNGAPSATPVLTITDASVTAAGYPGLYNGKDSTTVVMSVDDFSADNTIVPKTVVAVTDSNWKWSPYNWDTNGAAKIAVNGGAYFKLGFTGTSVAVNIDVSSLVAASVTASWYPIIRYSVDGGAQTDLQLTPSTTQLAIAGLSPGSHDIEVMYLAGFWENIGGTAPDRWTTPAYCLKITGAAIDTTAATVAPAWCTKNMIWFGDSISEGIRANNATAQPANQNAYESAPMFLAAAFDAELGNVSFGGMNYAAGFNSVPAMNTSYSSYYGGRSRLSGGVLSPAPDYVGLWNGANGAPAQADVQTAITNMRTIAPTAQIFVAVPVGGYGRANITAAVAAYKAANASDKKVYLIDLGSTWEAGLNSFGAATKQGIDGLHPRANWNARIASALTDKMQTALDTPAAPSLTSRTVTLTLNDRAGSPRANLSGLKWAFFDAITPNLVAAPASQGSAATTNASGVLTLMVQTTLAASATGWLVLSDSAGNAATASNAFSGPVTVA